MAPRIDTSGAGATYVPGADLDDTAIDNVRLGETSLSQVAQRLGLDPDALRQANPQISDPNHLMVGQEVRLPECRAPQGPSGADPGGTSASPSGPSLLDDPMSKTMAQMQLGGGGQKSAGPASGAKYAGPPKSHQREQWLGELARFPGEAHQAWKKLSSADRSAVLAKMEKRYGKAFAQQFREAAEKGKSQVDLSTYSTSPASKFPTMTAKQLEALGYRKAGDEVTGTSGLDIEVWVNPSGRTARLITSEPASGNKTDRATESSSDKTPATTGPEIDGPDDPLTEKQDKAEELSSRLEDVNRQISELLSSKNVPWDEVAKKFHEANDILGDLKDLGAPSGDPTAEHTLDMDGVDENFYQRLDEMNQQLLDLRGQASEKNPDFETLMQQPYVSDPADQR